MHFIQKWAIALAVLLGVASSAQAEEHATSQIGLYGFMLDQPLPELPVCTEQMIWSELGDETCFQWNDGYFSENRPVLKLLADYGVARFPRNLQTESGYPAHMTVGYDDNHVVTWLRVMPRKGIAVQDDMVRMVSEQLGKPAAMAIRDDNDDPFKAPPDGISLEMWFSADPGAIVAEWQTDYAWARYVGQLPGSTEGYLEIGLKRIIQNGQLPEWR